MTPHKIITSMLLLFALTTQSQDKRFTVFAYSDPNATINDGFNMGFGIDYQMTISYFKAQIFVFPNLRGKKYIELTGTPIGFNQHFNNDRWRLHQGFKVGLIFRDATHPTIGFEGGLQYYFNSYNNGLYVGLDATYDYRTDGKEEECDIKPYWRQSSFIKIGISF